MNYLPLRNHPNHGFETLHVAAGKWVLGVDVWRHDLGEEFEILGIESETIKSQHVLNGEIVDWVGRHWFFFSGQNDSNGGSGSQKSEKCYRSRACSEHNEQGRKSRHSRQLSKNTMRVFGRCRLLYEVFCFDAQPHKKSRLLNAPRRRSDFSKLPFEECSFEINSRTSIST